MADENQIQKLLQQSFPESDKRTWEKIAISEVDGNEPLEKLKWLDEDGNQFVSYYTREDVTQLQYLGNFSREAVSNTFLGNRTWLNMPSVAITDELSANKIALDHLSAGADGIAFDLNLHQLPDLDILLENIDWRYCRLSFFKIDDVKFINAVNEFVTRNYPNAGPIAGNLFWKKTPLFATNNFKSIIQPGFELFGCTIKSSTPIQEIVEALLAGIQFLEKTDEAFETVFTNISFSIPINNNFLTSIAKLKALRLLWYQVSQAYRLKNYKLSDLHIHARSEKWLNEKFHPHGNMLKSTTAAVASIAGGCDSLTIFPEDPSNSVMSRIARNVSNILREESHFNKVADPLAGAYAIDTLTDTFAKKAWTQFQNTMKK
jgi:methylmalonyl-CoA mutase